MRYVVIDLETNGFPPKNPYPKLPKSEWTLPFASYPIQLSVDIVEEDGVVYHAYDTIIAGATGLAPWVKEHVPISLEQIRHGESFTNVLEHLAGLLQDGDTIVAHNVGFDVGLAIGTTAERLGINSLALGRILEAPRFCTMRCAYSKEVFGRQPKLIDLCKHFEVSLDNAHDARADSHALACCVSEAIRRGVMLTTNTNRAAQTSQNP
jgi:DNA polymerase III epsilon subunit-like protein